jgi:peptidoglycan-associated lipoprotein
MLLVFTVALAAGCARKSKAVSAKFPAEETTAQAKPAPEAGTEGKLGEGTSGKYEEGNLALNQDKRPGLAMDFQTAGQDLKTIYFDYDSANLSTEAKASLETAAEWLKTHPAVNIKVEGNCDERGTSEYNLSLGERRALAARRYLISLGIGDDRIFTISYGEEKPASDGHDESAWKLNRRDEFKVSPL